ncbi:MAG: hypothetical protein AB7Q97_12695 [Gammaproteobacteria bacterium]
MPVTLNDELMCHQVVSSFDHVDSSDLQWCERAWFSAFDTAGEMFIGAGVGKYTNRNVLDAYASLVVGEQQHNVRASRELRPDVDVLKVGPIAYDIVENFKKVRFCLGENDYGISFEIEAEGIAPVLEQRPQMFRRSRGRVVNHMIRFFQYGRCRGWIKLDGRTYGITPDKWVSQRDRSWGIRRSSAEFYPPPEGVDVNFGLQPPKRAKISYYWHAFQLQFNDWVIQYEGAESPEGERLGTHHGDMWFRYGDSRRPVRVVDVSHEWELVPGTSTNEVKSVRDLITLEDGTTKEIKMTPLTRYSRKTGGYFGYRGWSSGAWMGEKWVAGETLNLTDEVVQQELKGGVWDYAVECRCGDEVGYGNIEPFIEGIG